MAARGEICGVSGVTAAMLMLTAAGLGQPVISGGCDGTAGSRISGYRWDPVLRQRWAVRANCAHPERPEMAERVAGSAETATAELRAELPVIRPGDAVRVRMSSGMVRMELSGVAEENGFTGMKVRVRLVHVAEAETGTQQRLEGVVRGRGEVEVLP